MMIKKLVEDLLCSLEGSNVDEVEYEADGIRLRLVRRSGTDKVRPVAPNPSDHGGGPQTTDAQSKTFQICANMHGTFYRAASPEEPPFVEPGQQIAEGQQVAVLEAMKMLHEIEADTAGTITNVLIEDGAAVEPGTALFTVERADV